MTKFRFGFGLLGLLISGCASGSVLSEAGDATEAIGHYAIPKALFEVTLELKYPAAYLNSRASLKSGQYSLSVTKMNPVFVPATYISVYYKRNSFSNDIVVMEVDEKGMLKQVSIDVDDKSGAFVGKLLELGIKAAKAATAFPGSTFTFDQEEVTQTVSFILDPYAGPIRIDPIPQKIGEEIDISIISASNLSQGTHDKDEAYIHSACGVNICYPEAASARVVFKGQIGANEERLISIPDLTNLRILDLKRASLVKKTFTADFTNGMLKKVSLNKPSEAMAGIQIPINVVEELVKLPTELVQLKIDTTNKEKDAAAAEKALIDAQKALIESVQEYQKTLEAVAPEGSDYNPN
ncbi:hypothetical protein [Hyphococcus sp.]|uniref:hypothetical protein n=1 Tax=Hyphococcus sp. TaxID=2038636 RepID=UPI003D11A305